MPTPAYVPYWPSLPVAKHDPFTLWFLTANNGSGLSTTVTDFPNIGNRIARPEGDPYGLDAGPYLVPLPGTLDSGLIPFYGTPTTFSYSGRFGADLGLLNAFGFLGISDSTLGFGNGLLHPVAQVANPPVAPFQRTGFRQVQNIGLVVETDGYGNTGIMLQASGQCSRLVSADPPALGASPDVVPGGLSVVIKYGSLILWTLPIANVVIDSVSAALKVDVTQQVDTSTYTDEADPAYITGDNPTGIFAQTVVTDTTFNPLYSHSSYAWTGHVVIAPIGSVVPQIVPDLPLQPINQLPSGFEGITGVCPSTIFPPGAQTDDSVPIQATGAYGFSEFILPNTLEAYEQINNRWDYPGRFNGTIPDPIVTFPAAPYFPSFISVLPPTYLWYSDHF